MTTPVRLVQGLAHTAVDTVRHPVAGAARVVGLARGALHVATKAPGIVADTFSTRTESTTEASSTPTPGPTHEPVPEPAPEARAESETSPSGVRSAPPEGGVPDLEPPDPADRVLVVEEALAAEGEQPRFGRTTEPHAASRDEEHGESSLHPAEIEELEEEAEARE